MKLPVKVRPEPPSLICSTVTAVTDIIYILHYKVKRMPLYLSNTDYGLERCRYSLVINEIKQNMSLLLTKQLFLLSASLSLT